MLSIILVNWNSWHHTISCIQSLLNANPVPFRVIVVDNDSIDDSMNIFERWAHGDLELVRTKESMEYLSRDGASKPRRLIFGRYLEKDRIFEGFVDCEENFHDSDPVVYVVDSGRNGGFGFGNNVGMLLADTLGSSVYWLLNNDCVVSRNALVSISKAVHCNPRVIFGNIVRFYHSPRTIQAYGGGHLSRWLRRSKLVTTAFDSRSLNFIYGASIAFSPCCRSEVGDFDENIFMYFEENDFCMTAQKVGFEFKVIEADIYHKHGGSQGKGGSSKSWLNVMLNKHYVMKKHFGLGLWTIYYYAVLLFRSFMPIGDINARLGSREALKRLFLRGE